MTLDPECLARLATAGGPDLVVQLVDRFLENAPGTLQAAVEAFERGEHETVREVLHPLEGSAGMLGAEALRLGLRAVGRESRGRTRQDLAELEAELGRVLRELQAQRAKLSAGQPSNL